MLNVMKRQKLDVPAPPPLPTRMHHSQLPTTTTTTTHMHYQQQQQRRLYGNADIASYASLQQQLHYKQHQRQQQQQQQQRLLAGQSHNSAPSAPAPPQYQTAVYGATTGSMLTHCTPNAQTMSGAKRRYEHFDTYHQTQSAQFPSMYHTSASASSAMAAAQYAPSTPATLATQSPVAATASHVDSPQSLPGISTMLRRPSSSTTGAGAAPATRSTTSSNGSNMAVQPQAPPPQSYKWTSEATATSPLKPMPALPLTTTAATAASNSGVYYDAHRLSPLRGSPVVTTARSAAATESLTSLLTSSGRLATAAVAATDTGVNTPLAVSTRHESFDAFERRSFSSVASSSSSSSNNTPRGDSDARAFAHRFTLGGIKCDDATPISSISATSLSTPATTPPSGASTTDGGGDERIANPNKNSRYLREMDRRKILSRIDAGEKQATLAKEYQVSRAAICNLNKHREEVMSRSNENPLAKHPKKPRPKTFKIKIRSAKSKKLPSPRGGGGAAGSISGTGVSGKSTNVHEVKSRAAALLLTSVRNRNTSLSEFCRSSERLLRLVLEEALALVPIKAVEVYLSDSVRADGVGWEHPPCAISLEQPASPLLDLFRALEPDQPTARARVQTIDSRRNRTDSECSVSSVSPSAGTNSLSVTLEDAQTLPASLKYHNVFLLELSATVSADAICCVLQTLLQRGAVESMVSLIVLFVTTEVVRAVRQQFPGVKIVAAQIDPSGRAPASLPTECGDTSSATASSALMPPPPPSCLESVLDRFRHVYA